MTYTIATRDTIAQQFVPVSGLILMPLSAQELAKEYRSSGIIEAVAFNTQGV